jgi:hypothetical protein
MGTHHAEREPRAMGDKSPKNTQKKSQQKKAAPAKKAPAPK